ncbi:MAG: metallophosphoesterase family protein [Chloroflexota bacterium]
MRILIISDIHGNLTALEAVLADADGSYDTVWCLGDLVGYGPDPNECVERVRALSKLTCLVGNHDKAAIGDIDIKSFNLDARTAIAWTQEALTPASREYLINLPEKHVQGVYTLVHASPRQPVWEYILDAYIASQNFSYFETPYCLVGHTHIPVIYQQEGTTAVERRPNYDELTVFGNERLIINPGSVGQPRDSNPDASYAILDFEGRRWEYRRAPYNVAETQRRMTEHKMPVRLISRLQKGW